VLKKIVAREPESDKIAKKATLEDGESIAVEKDTRRAVYTIFATPSSSSTTATRGNHIARDDDGAFNRVSFDSVVSAVDTTCANADTPRTSSGVHPENARSVSVVYSSNSISSRRRGRRRRRRRHRVRVRARAAFGEVPPLVNFIISTNVSAVASRARSSSASSEFPNDRVSASRR